MQHARRLDLWDYVDAFADARFPALDEKIKVHQLTKLTLMT